jgi:hypothetical protein
LSFLQQEIDRPFDGDAQYSRLCRQLAAEHGRQRDRQGDRNRRRIART